MINTQMSFRQSQPSPYIRRPAGRPTPTSLRPGDKIKSKTQAFSLDKYDWRSDVLAENYARSVPVNPSNRVTLVDADQIRPGSLENRLGGTRTGREVDLEGLIHDGKIKREKRTTTATSLGFDFVVNPSITPLPDTDVPATSTTTKPRTIALANPLMTKMGVQVVPSLSSTPQTPGLIREPAELEEEEEDEDDEWERVSTFSTGQCLSPTRAKMGDIGTEDEGEVVVLGELELEDADSLQVKESTKGEQVKLSYAAIARML